MPRRNGWRGVCPRSVDFHSALLTTRGSDA